MIGLTSLTKDLPAFSNDNRFGVASCINSAGVETLAMDLAPELNPHVLNLSVAPIPALLDYEQGGVATYRDSHFLVVRWNPRRLGDRAAAQTEKRLRTATPGKVILLCYDMDGWCIERLFSPQAAAERFRDLSAIKNLAILPTTFVRQIDPSANAAVTPFIGLAYSLWRQMLESKCGEAKDAFWRLAHKRAVLVSADDDDDILQLSHIGNQAPILRYYGQEWKNEALSINARKLGAHNRHESRMNVEYQEVARLFEPRLDYVFGHLELPSGLSAWVQYQRLMLPIPSGTHVPAVQVFTDLMPNQAFPFLANSWHPQGPVNPSTLPTRR